MKVKFDTVFRGAILFLCLIVAWSVWAGAQEATNAAAPPRVPSTLVTTVERAQGHYLTFGLDRVPLLKDNSFWGEPVWKYVASMVYILLAFYAAKLIDLVARVWLKNLAAKTETPLDDLVLELLRGPLKVVVFVLLVNIGLNVFEWPERARLYLSKGLILVVAGALTWLAVKIVNLLLNVWRQRTAQETNRKFNDQLFSVLRKSINAFIIIVAVLVTAQNIGITITAAITSLSIGGIAVGLAAQDTLANLFGAVAVFADQPFVIGDQIKLEAGEGIVEDVGLRSTRIRNPEGHLIAIPNKTVGNAAVTNISRRANIKTVMNLALPRTLPIAKVKRALALLEEIYRGNNMTQDVWVSFNQFAGANLNIMVVHWWKGTDYQHYLAGMQTLNLEVKERFDAEQISTV
jgi:MscS family membrane protein